MERKLPKTLYRYRAMDNRHDMNAIQNRYLWLSERKALNDPFEMEAIPKLIMPCPIKNPEGVADLLRLEGASEPKIVKYLANPNIKYAVNQQKRVWQKAIRSQYESFRDRTRICCFADKCDNVLMWSHYGKALQGVVFGFDVTELADGDNPADVFLPVSYPPENVVPEVNMLPIYLSKNDKSLKASSDVCKRMFATKSTHWEYEQEWRILNEHQKVPYSKNAIVEVVFGERTLESVENEVRSAFIRSPVRFKRAVREKRKFALKIQDA